MSTWVLQVQPLSGEAPMISKLLVTCAQHQQPMQTRARFFLTFAGSLSHSLARPLRDKCVFRVRVGDRLLAFASPENKHVYLQSRARRVSGHDVPSSEDVRTMDASCRDAAALIRASSASRTMLNVPAATPILTSQLGSRQRCSA